MRILVAYEESQAVTKAFRALGHKAFSCDILPCSGGHPEWHIQKDVLPLLKLPIWDMIIAFPPCTYLSNAGARHLFAGGVLNQERYKKGLEAKKFFMEFYNAPCKKIAIENPVASKIYEMPLHTQEIQPWQFGHPVTKKTRLWLKGLPKLQPTNIVEPGSPFCPSGTGRKQVETYGAAKRGNDRINRSKTFTGIAQAMAEQWGQL